MDNSKKVIYTIVAVVVFILLFAVVAGASSDAGAATPGIFGLILFGALVFALRAIWKKGEDQ